MKRKITAGIGSRWRTRATASDDSPQMITAMIAEAAAASTSLDRRVISAGSHQPKGAGSVKETHSRFSERSVSAR